jgi:hypothetical protein
MQQLLELHPTPSPSPAVADPDYGDTAASSATWVLPSRNASSKYNFVKVKV